MERRRFLKVAGAGAAVVSLPALVSCGSRATLLGKGTTSSGANTTYFDNFGVSQALLQRTMEKALSRGGDFCDIFLQHNVQHWTGMEDGQVNRAYSTIDLGAGIRVLKGDATGFAYCEDLSEKALMSAAGTAAAVADSSRLVHPQPLAAHTVANHYPVEVPWEEVGTERKLPVIELAEKTARERDSRVFKVSVFLGDESSHILLVNSEGRLVEDSQPMATMWVTCVAQQDDQIETASDSISGRADLSFVSGKNVTDLAMRTTDQVVRGFDAVLPPIGEMPVVLAAARSGILLHEAIGHPMEADFNRKGISIYADRIGAKISSEHVTIIDDATNPGLRGSINMDDEGQPGQKTVLVENGVLRSYLHDRISASHYKTDVTGSGRRQSFRYPPVPRMRNTYMLDGPHDPEEVIGSVKNGIYAETFSNGQVNIGAGDFTFYLKQGRLIEDGKLTAVIKDANLIGNGPQVLAEIDMVGNDAAMMVGGGSCGKDGQFVPVGFGLPTVRAGSMSVGGRNA